MIYPDEFRRLMDSVPDPDPPKLSQIGIDGLAAPTRKPARAPLIAGYVRCSCCGEQFPEDDYCRNDHV